MITTPLNNSHLMNYCQTGEQALLVAVIRQSIEDLWHPGRWRAAESWLLSENDALGSFNWCCELLLIDPEVVRLLAGLYQNIPGRRTKKQPVLQGRRSRS
ncbi:MAG: hypothetical protein GX751_04870 [Desulfuromonadaceae bacterium]|nr:hypothetical protein [Desulfuromonadaceae bacterium]